MVADCRVDQSAASFRQLGLHNDGVYRLRKMAIDDGDHEVQKGLYGWIKSFPSQSEVSRRRGIRIPHDNWISGIEYLLHAY